MDKRIVAVVIEGRFRDSALLNKFIKKEKRFIAHEARKYKENRGGIFLLYPDETFMDISYWDTVESAERIIEKELMKGQKGVYDGELMERLSLKYYRVKWESLRDNAKLLQLNE